MINKLKLRQLRKVCVICGKQMKVILYNDHSYRGGHYFGKVSLAGKPYKHPEYWECPKCYW